MAVSPSGLFSLPVDYLRKTIAGSSTFRTLTGAADAAAALAFAHAFEVTGASLDDPFFAVVEYGTDWARNRHAGGTNNFFEQESGLHVWFHQTIAQADEVDAMLAFTNSIGAILSEMEQLSGTAGYLDIRATRLIEGPFRPEEDEAASQTYGDFFRILFAVEYESI